MSGRHGGAPPRRRRSRASASPPCSTGSSGTPTDRRPCRSAPRSSRSSPTRPPRGERFLRTDPGLSEGWFVDLSASLAALRAYPTDRQFPVHDPEEYGYLLGATYRRPVPADCVPAFGTEHIDLNWQNITAPRYCILDMEHWCSAVTGYGAAYLYLTALEVPRRGRSGL